MADLKEIAEFLGVSCLQDRSITNALSIDDADFNANSIGWCSDKNVSKLSGLNEGVILLSPAAKSMLEADVRDLVYLVVDSPRRSFAKLLSEFFVEKEAFGSIASTAVIHDNVNFNPEEVIIGENVVIEKGCVLKKGAVIGHNSVLKSGTHVGERSRIGSNCTIGGVGFGYEPGEDGNYEVIPHIGTVFLDDDVEVGNNVCIDRAVMGKTYLGKNVKVDNLVHIAHGVEVGDNSLIIAHAMIAGSVKIGKNVWVAPNAAIRQKLSIDDNATVGMGSVVVKDVEHSTTVAGVPARSIQKK